MMTNATFIDFIGFQSMIIPWDIEILQLATSKFSENIHTLQIATYVSIIGSMYGIY